MAPAAPAWYRGLTTGRRRNLATAVAPACPCSLRVIASPLGEGLAMALGHEVNGLRARRIDVCGDRAPEGLIGVGLRLVWGLEMSRSAIAAALALRDVGTG